MKPPVIPVRGDEKCGVLSKVLDKLEREEKKKLLARYKITPANRAIRFLKAIVPAVFFRLKISCDSAS